jgi:hypothetical protein
MGKIKTKTPYQRFLEQQAKEYEEKRKEELMRDAVAAVDERITERAKNYDIVWLYTLHTFSKTKKGKQVCREFYLEVVRNYLGMLNQWQSGGDDSHFWIMEERLKADGIDVDELIREADELAKEIEND